MPKASQKRVQCPDPTCGKIQKTRGQHYFVCSECRTTFDIEPNKYVEGESNNVQYKQDNEPDSRRNKPQGDMGETRPQGVDSGEDREQPHTDTVQGDTEQQEEGLKFG